MKADFDITGMNCAACSAAVERAVNAIGADSCSVNLLSGVLNVEYDENKISDKDIMAAVKKAGFGIDYAKSAAEKRLIIRRENEKNQRQLFIRLISSLCLMLPLMYLSMAHMVHLPDLSAYPIINAVCQFIICVPILIINKNYFSGGFKHLIAKSPNMDSLIAVGTTASFLYGVYATVGIIFGKQYHLYYETAAMIPTLVTVGKYLEGRSRSGTGKALEMLIDLTPKYCTVIRDGNEIEVEAEKLNINDTVIIKPGQSFPCDGTVIFGESFADESSLTGESIPVEKTVGSKVSAGTVNKNGTLKVCAQKVGDDTVISSIVRLVEKASGSKAPIARLADKISAVFVPVVIAISLITFIIHMLLGIDFDTSFSRAICVLVISCPCSLGLATPIAVTVGTGVAASKGILIKSAVILEQMGHIKTVLFDKTGTLTKGTPSLTDIVPSERTDKDRLLFIAASCESLSEHPLARAIVSYTENSSISLTEPSSFEAISGKGFKAIIEGKECLGGNILLLSENGIELSQETHTLFESLSSQGKTPLFFAFDNVYYGCIAVADIPKEDSKAAVSKLKELDITSVMITGDNEITANAIAKSIGIDKVCASVTPEQKEEYVRKFREKYGVVAMCGDGINDSPALASADVGISLSKGTDIAIETADVILMHSDTYSVPRAIALSRSVISNIKLSLFWALLYNTLGIPIAAGVFYPLFGIELNPMIGAAAMSLSSICVVLNALRLKKFKFD